MASGIYTIKNKVNGKIYVGKAKRLSSRKREHFSLLRSNKHYNIHLQSSWNKYGEENFEFNIIEICDNNILSVREYHWCNFYNSLNDKKGYNLAIVNSETFNMSEESKRKISEKRKGIKFTDKHKLKLSISHIGKSPGNKGTKANDELRKKLSDSHKGFKRNEESIQKQIESHSKEKHYMYGKKHSEESKIKMANAKKGRVLSEEHKKKISESIKNKKCKIK